MTRPGSRIPDPRSRIQNNRLLLWPIWKDGFFKANLIIIDYPGILENHNTIRWVVYGQSLGPHVIFETFRYLVEDWEELGPPTETSRWNLSHGMGFDGRKDHPRPQNPRKSLKIVFSKIWVDSWMNFLGFWDKNQCIRFLPMRSTRWTSQNLWISI